MQHSRIRIFAWLPLFLLLLTVSQGVFAAPLDHPHHNDQVLIKFKDTASQSQKDAILGDLGAVHVKSFKRIKVDHKHLSKLNADEAIARYKNHPAIEFIEPNYILTINDIPNDDRFDNLWGMLNEGQTGGTPGADISATAAWDIFTGSSNVVIGVIDSGVDYNHSDLAANIWTNPGEIAGNGIDDDGNGFIDDIHGWDFCNYENDPMDDNGHGTHCAGTIGGVGNNGTGVAGVNWNVSIMPLKFIDSTGAGNLDDALEAIEYATMMGVNLTSNSWGGGGYSEALRQAIEEAGKANILFVVAAGNSGTDNDLTPTYPASYTEDNVVSVAATDHFDGLAWFSCYGQNSVDLAAPGDNIFSTLPGNSYGTMSGTSMAAPHVAGALGLIMGRFPEIDALDAKSLILDSVDPKASLDGMVLSGGRLNVFRPMADPDSTPPGMIADLAVNTVGSNWMDLSWTAPGDDDYTGEASRFDVRYSLMPLDETTWDTATTVSGEPNPGTVGTYGQMRVSGLDFSTGYYLAVKALDEFGNASPISNIAQATTLGAPDIAASPGFLSADLITGETEMQTLTLSNVGAGTLDFAIPVPSLMGAPVTAQQFLPLAKGEVDTRTSGPVIEGFGGPDAFGYRWADSNDPYGPTFDWTDISEMGSVAMSTGDDENSGPFDLGFTFPFYDGEFTEFRICSNGFLSFSSLAADFGNNPIPSVGSPGNLVAPFWDDMDVADGSIFYYNDGGRMIVQWDQVSRFGTAGSYTFQAHLYPDGTIEYHYLSIGEPNDSATVGIQNGTGTDGLQVVFNAPYVTDGLAVQIKAAPQWVTVTPASGTVWAPGSDNLDVTFNATGLMGGVYNGMIRILSNDPDEPDYMLPVELSVTGAPEILVEPLSQDFGGVFLGSTPTLEVLVGNAGTADLTISGITIDEAAFTADADAFVLNPGESRIVTVTFNPTMIQPYAGSMNIASNSPVSPVTVVALSGVGMDPPQFSINPESLASDLYTGDSEEQIITLTNSGGSNFEFNCSIDFEDEVAVNEYVEVGKDEVDARAGVLGSGGPDMFGYHWKDSDHPDGPTFDWTDISTTGTSLILDVADDQTRGPLPIGFDFEFYGEMFSEFHVCTNGFLSFTSGNTSLDNQPLPNSGAPENLLAVFWDDLRVEPLVGANIYYEYDGSKLIVQFDKVPRYYETGSLTFQVLLYPDGSIVYQYLEMDAPILNEATIGIQNGTKDDGLTVAFNTDYMHDNLAVRFQNVGSWIAVSPASGVVAPGSSMDVTARFNAAELIGGTYNANILIDTNDPAVEQFVLPASLTVTGAPNLAVNAMALDFGDCYIGQPAQQNLIISNTGTDMLTISDVTIDNEVFSTDLTTPLVLGPMQDFITTIVLRTDSTGDMAGILTLISDDHDTPQMEIALAGVSVSPPVASVDPDSIYVNLLSGQIEVQTVTLTNSGLYDLDFNITDQLGATESVVHTYEEMGKDDLDTRSGVLGSGGPDMYGYHWLDSDDPDGPIFNWEDISATGTQVFTIDADDGNRGPLPIGFDFSFYGEVFSDFYVCSNGWLSFTDPTTTYLNQWLPNSGAPENLLAPFWDDLKVDLSIGSNVYYEYDGTKLIVQFDHIVTYDSSGGPYTFQVQLHPDGTIFYQYLSMPGQPLESATVGIQNGLKDDGLNIAFNTDYVHDELAIRIFPIKDWLTVSPTTGTVAPGASTMLNVTMNAGGMYAGVYEGVLVIDSNDPVNGVLQIPAVMDVIGAPVLAVDSSTLAFGDVSVGYAADMELRVTNEGTNLLSVSAINSSLGVYTVDPMVLEIKPGQSAVVTVTFAPVELGSQSGTLELVSNDMASPMTVQLEGNGANPPIAVLSHEMIEVAGMPGGSTTTTLTVCNEGGSPLVWAVDSSQDDIVEQVQYEYLDVSKDEKDPRPGILGSGGPDTFGHTWIDSDDPNGPFFDWVDISAIGTQVFSVSTDDGNNGPFPVGFDFPFYENTFTEFMVCSNGFISFTSSSDEYINQPLPNTNSPENMLALYWDDFSVDMDDANQVYYHYDGTRLIVQYEVRLVNTSGDPEYHYSMQAILYPNGNIVYQYNTMGIDQTSATIGIQNATRNDALMMVFNEAYVHDGMAILISSFPRWLSASPKSGVIPVGECANIDVTMDATSLEDGDYTGALTMTSNDPTASVLSVDVLFHVASLLATDTMVEPETLNLDNNGKWMAAYIELPEMYSVADVLVETVLFNGVVPVDGDNFSLDEDFNKNGIPDMMFKFDRSLIEGALSEGEEVEVKITGEVRDAAYFVATDTIRVIQPKITSPNGDEEVSVGTTVTVAWENPDNWNVDHSDLFYTLDEGETWNLIAANIDATSFEWTTPMETSETVKVRIFAFDNQGLLGYDSSDEFFTLSPNVTGVDDVLPGVFALSQNYPNPFNPMTTIRFDLPKAGYTNLAIYDLRGRMICELISEPMTAGSHDIVWRGKDQFGQQVSSGVYYYRIKSGTYKAVKSMTLLK